MTRRNEHTPAPSGTVSVAMIQYRTTPDAAQENQALIEQVFEELHGERPDGVRYTAFRLDDGVTFLHIASFDGDDTPLARLPAFMEFQHDIGRRLTTTPTRSRATMIGSYGYDG